MPQTRSGHDYSDPISYLNAIEMSRVAARPGPLACRHCEVRFRLLPMVGNAWALDVTHDPGCPDHDDDEETNP